MAKKQLYSVHPSVFTTMKWVDDLPGKTGRSLDQWIKHIKKAGPATEKERATWLKQEYQLGTNTAGWLATQSVGKGQEDLEPAVYLATAEQWVADMIAKKPLLEPLYFALLQLGKGLGKDVQACPCKTMVPFYRNNVFANLTLATKTRLDLGLCLRGVPFEGRLIDTGGTAKKDRITHKISISSLSEIDAEVKGWLTKAYEKDGVKP